MRNGKRRAAVGTVGAGIAMLFGASSASAAITVSTVGDEVNISSTNNVLETTVSYQLSADEFVISEAGGAAATTSDGDCTVDGTSIVRCEDNGEDTFDVDFGSSGGFVNLDLVSGLVPGRFHGLITLGNGSETVDGTDGADVIAAASNSTVNGDTVRALDGDDTITTGNGSDIVSGGDGADTIVANDGNNVLNGGEVADDDAGDGNDTITGGPLFDVIDGGLGDDTLNGGTDADSTDNSDFDQIDGRRGNDTINAGDGPDTDIDGGPGNDVVNGDSGNDELFGGANASGPADVDTLNGGTGADVLLNSPGADAFNGGTSTGDLDEVDYSQTSGSSPITADIDGTAGDDGANCQVGPCEGDTVAADVEDLTGDGGDDILTGSSAGNVLDGGAGDDTLDGGSGTGADGTDRFIGGADDDLVDYTGRTAALVITIDGTANDGAGGCPSGAGCEDDDVETDVEDLIGGSAGDTLTGSSGPNRLFGGSGGGADTLNGSGGDDLLGGGDRFNNLADGADVFNGGANAAGGDTVTYSNRGAVTASIDGVANDHEGDNVSTDVENLTGSNSGGDTLSGSTAANVINGQGGNDTISGGSGSGTDGNDTLIGGSGTSDTVSYAARTGDIDADLDLVNDDGEGTEADIIDATTENLTGGSGDDDLGGSASANVLNGGPGDDELLNGAGGPNGADTYIGGTNGTPGGQNSDDGDLVQYRNRTQPLTITMDGVANDGSAGENDSIPNDIERVEGGDQDDVFTGNANANAFTGGVGADTMRGGTGTGPDGADRFVGGSGVDTLDYSNRTDDLTVTLGTFGTGPEGDTNNGVDDITGGSGNDTLRGDVQPNRLSGGAGNDTLAGGTGTGPDGADVFLAGPSAGNDTVTYANRTDAVHAAITGTNAGDSGGNGGAEGDGISTTIDNLTGGSAGDELIGDAKPNTVEGGGGSDDIDAGGGDDVVRAQDGLVDTVACGTEADTVFADTTPADVLSDCESVNPVVEPPPPPPPPDPPDDPPATPPATPPSGGGNGDAACSAARAKLAKAKQKLRRAKDSGTRTKVAKAKQKVKRARAKVREACG